MEVQTFTAVVHEEEDMHIATCPEVETLSRGKTLEEAIGNLKEATELYLEEFPFVERGRTYMTTFDVASIAGT